MPSVLAHLKVELGISNSAVFDEWLVEERAYLQGLVKEPLAETLQMEYYTKLVKFYASEYVVTLRTPHVKLTEYRAKYKAASNTFVSSGSQAANSTHTLETARRHAGETLDRDAATVQVLELRLEIITCWTLETPAFEETAKMVAMRQYQRCLDTLKGLVVAQIFELTKMNRSQTGMSINIKLCTFTILTHTQWGMPFANILGGHCKNVRPPFEPHWTDTISPPGPCAPTPRPQMG